MNSQESPKFTTESLAEVKPEQFTSVEELETWFEGLNDFYKQQNAKILEDFKLKLEENKREYKEKLDIIGVASENSTQIALETGKMIETVKADSTSKEKFRDKFKRFFKKTFRVLSFATVLTSAASIMDYTVTRYKVESKVTNNSEVAYSHQDPDTTHLINILAGKESLTDSDKREILMDYLVDALKSVHKEDQYTGIDLGDLEKMSLDELNDTAQEFMRYNGEAERDLIPKLSPETTDPELYKALWTLEQECGNPKVKFRLGSKKKIFFVYNSDTIPAFYNPYTNTVFIDVGDNEEAIDNYIAELSHGKQFNENPIQSNILLFKGILKSVGESLTSDTEESAQGAYQELYTEPGTLEYNAHKVIEPKLITEEKNLTPTRTAKQEKIAQQVAIEIKKINEEEKKALDDSEDYYLAKQVATHDQGELEKLYKESSDNVNTIRKDSQDQRNAVHKRFEAK